MKVLLQENSLNLRGTSIAVYDYAYFLKKNYGYDCYITFNKADQNTNTSVLQKFTKDFEVIPYTQTRDIDQIITKQQIDVLYTIKSGSNNGYLTDKVKTCIHAVFPTDVSEKHGSVYAYVSEWLSNHCSKGIIPYVPHMVNLPVHEEHYREQLNIPKNVIVFGRYGGHETFDIPFVYNTIKDILEKDKDVYFLFCNTYVFINHPRVIFTNNTASLNEKVKFINTCDAFLHARYRGETFGLSILEFMSKNKPVFTFGLSEEKHHYSMLDEQGYIYNDHESLFNLIKNFTPKLVQYKQLHKFLPQPVMKQFHDTFLK